MSSLSVRHLSTAAALVAAISCGDVPTLDGGIAYVTPILLPSPAVAVGDVLRDSLGNPALLQVRAFDNNNVLIPNVRASFLLTSPLPALASQPALAIVDSGGRVTAGDSVNTLTIVARVGTRIQTTPATLFVVPQPDSIERTSALDSLVSFTKTSGLSVKVTGLRRGLRVPVPGIVVKYRIVRVNGSAAVDSSPHTLVDDASVPLRADPHAAVDTTSANDGAASRFLLPVGLAGVDSIVVEARANSLKGVPLTGSPVRFVLPVKKGS